MVTPTDIAAAFSSLKIANDLAKSMVGIRDETMMLTKVNALTNEITSAMQAVIDSQADQIALQGEVRALKAEIAAIEDWKSEAARYKLADFGEKTFAYVLRADAAKDSEPEHYACPNCYRSKRISILQYGGKNLYGQNRYDCTDPQCKVELSLGPRVSPSFRTRTNMA